MRIIKSVGLNLLVLVLSGFLAYLSTQLFRTGIFYSREGSWLMRGGFHLIAALAGLAIALFLGARIVALLMASVSTCQIVEMVINSHYPPRILGVQGNKTILEPALGGTPALRAVLIAALLGVMLGAIVTAYGSKLSLRLFVRKHPESTGSP